MQDSQQQVLHIDKLGVLYSSFKNSQLQNIVGLFVQGDFAYVGVFLSYFLFYALFQFRLKLLDVYFQSAKQIYYGSALSSENAKQQMLRANRLAGQAIRLFPAKRKDF